MTCSESVPATVKVPFPRILPASRRQYAFLRLSPLGLSPVTSRLRKFKSYNDKHSEIYCKEKNHLFASIHIAADWKSTIQSSYRTTSFHPICVSLKEKSSHRMALHFDFLQTSTDLDFISILISSIIDFFL